MAYSPTDWADGLTPVDEAHLDKLEQGVVVADANATTALANAAAANAALPAKEDKANKGVAGGYASLDGTGVVPDAQIPAVIARDTEVAAAITGKEDKSAKGAASGYAPLDAGSKVPVANLPALGGNDYLGAYSAATAYKDGDIVSYNGVLYLCVTPTTGSPPENWGV